MTYFRNDEKNSNKKKQPIKNGIYAWAFLIGYDDVRGSS